MKDRIFSGWVMPLLLGIGLVQSGLANNISVTNVSLVRFNAAAQTLNVAFDVAWENSWRGRDNWDAAWVFIKFKAPGSNRWEHAQLSTNSGNHTPSLSSVISAVPDGKGVFVYRAGDYTGHVNYTQIKLQWDFGSNGYAFVKGDRIDVAVHAVEMVYIPQGAFYLGSGGTENGRFFQYVDGVDETQPYLVASENAITIGPASGNLYYKDSGQYPGDRTGVLSNDFPKGFNAFYCMKYEVSQGQYAEFLNKLTNDTVRFPGQTGTNRFTIGGPMGNRTASAPDRACNWMSWADVTAYADWAALRPMTELEFEKACRGPALPVMHEYAWGSTTIIRQTNYTGAADGSGLETALPTNANANYNSGIPAPQGPVRVGIFAQANSSREAAGASYWGVMELSGNLFERVVNIGNSAGRAFQGTLGDGLLDGSGNATGNSGWPAGNGSGWRGGYWYGGDTLQRASDRNNAVYDGGRHSAGGIRAVRQAP